MIAIHGPNGAGKTNILEAISMLSPGSGLRRAKTNELSRAPEMLGWKVSAQIDSLGRIHEVVTEYRGEGARTVSIDGKSAPQVALGKIAKIVWLVPVMDRLWVEGAEGRRRFLDRLALSFEPKHAEIALGYEKAMRERNRLLKDGVRDTSWYQAIEKQMAEYGSKLSQNRLHTIDRLSTAQSKGSKDFPFSELALEPTENDFVHIDATDLAASFEESRPRDMLAGRSLVGPHRQDLAAIYAEKGIPAKLCSTGEQKALLISLIIASGRALSEDFGTAPIYLLDEIAAHLDARRRAALYDEIETLGAQAWMTGTGSELFDELKSRAMFLEVNEGANGSETREGS